MNAGPTAETRMTDQAPPGRRKRLPRVRVSVRALMAVVLVLAIALGYYVRSVHVQQEAVAAVRHCGGSLDYDWRWGNYNPDIIDNDGKPRAPKWLARLVPVDYVANVVYVSIIHGRTDARPRADDETLAKLGRLKHLEALVLSQSAITDAGLANLRGLTNLRDLRIDHTSVSDAGVEHLKGLTGLRTIWISGSRITDEGVLALERALTEIQTYRWEEMVTSQNIPRAMADLDYARSQPARLAAALLVHRVRSLTFRHTVKEFIATVDALCALEANDKLSLIKLAEARAECLGFLDPSHSPGLPESERVRLRRLCADRGSAALAQAVELGYDNVRRLESGTTQLGIMLWNLHDHPGYAKLITEMKARKPSK